MQPKPLNYDALGVTPPTTQPHGTENQIAEQLIMPTPKNWRMQGNKLMADVPGGVMVQHLPTNYVLEGVNDDGTPRLKKIDITTI